MNSQNAPLLMDRYTPFLSHIRTYPKEKMLYVFLYISVFCFDAYLASEIVADRETMAQNSECMLLRSVI